MSCAKQSHTLTSTKKLLGFLEAAAVEAKYTSKSNS